MVVIKCPYCLSENTSVVDTRGSNDNTNRRRRTCEDCGKRFTTYERVELVELRVIKKDGRVEKFDRDKIRKGILRACEKRPISSEKIDNVVDSIERKLRTEENTDIKSSVIGEYVIDALKTLDEVAYIRFASVYRSFKDINSFEKELKSLKVVKRENNANTTDLALLVTSPRDVTHDWDKSRITKSLIKEAGLEKDDSEDIANEVEKKVFSSGLKVISVGLIRELVDNELFVRGYNQKLEKQNVIGMSRYNINQIIFNKNKENSNVVNNNPEAVNLAIAEHALKQYALSEIFSEDVANSHIKGALYLHDLGYPIRVYCSAHSPEYIKKYGLKLNNLSTTSKPAKYAGTLTGHINTFLASMQAYYAGALGISYINIFYAPLVDGMSYNEMKQQAQYLIFSCSQNAFSRGGQTLFIDFNVHTGIPKYMRDVPAIGAKGEYTGKTYGEYEESAQMFMRAMMDVWREGDANGMVFPFPKMDLHVSKETFTEPKQTELLKYACQIASENGAPYFVFDRDDVVLSACCRLRTKITDDYVLKHPESLRFCGFQVVTINLPQAAYRGKTVEETINEIKKTMKLAMKAHIQKKNFIKSIMDKPGTPLWQVGMTAADGRPYIDLDDCTYIIGLIGLNECVMHLTGKQLHEDETAYRLGLKIVSEMYLQAKEFEKETGLKVALEETPAESASLRLAKMDMMNYPESKNYIRGNQKTGEVYYTNSVHLVADADVDIIERIEKQGRFNSLIESGCITHVFIGEKRPHPESIFKLVKRTFENTQSAQITISPEFTYCMDCGRVSPGYGR